MVRTGSFSSVLPSLASETNAIACHVIGDDVANRMRDAQKAGVGSLEKCQVHVHQWTNCLRPGAPWSKLDGRQDALPSFFPDYCKVADPLETTAPEKVDWDNLLADGGDRSPSDNEEKKQYTIEIQSKGVPPLDKLLARARSATPSSVIDALNTRPELLTTTEPYEDVVTSKWCTEHGARRGLEEYCNVGRDEFANRYFKSNNVVRTVEDGQRSMYAQAAARILREYDNPSEVLALRETATRAFSSALKLGALSPRDVADAAKNRSQSQSSPFPWAGGGNVLKPSDDPLWGRSGEGSLHDVVEWREWFLVRIYGYEIHGLLCFLLVIVAWPVRILSYMLLTTIAYYTITSLIAAPC